MFVMRKEEILVSKGLVNMEFVFLINKQEQVVQLTQAVQLDFGVQIKNASLLFLQEINALHFQV